MTWIDILKLEMNKLLGKNFIIFMGAPGSGKTTIRKHFPGYIIASPDDIRMRILKFEETGVSYDPKIEPDIWDEAYLKVDESLAKNKNIIFDSTATTLIRRYELNGRARKYHYNIIIIFMNTTLLELAKRNVSRKKPVPDQPIGRLIGQLTYPKYWEYDIFVDVQEAGYKLYVCKPIKNYKTLELANLTDTDSPAINFKETLKYDNKHITKSSINKSKGNIKGAN